MQTLLFKIIYLLLFVSLALSFFNLKNLPDISQINQSLYKEPIQAANSTLGNFSFDYKNATYHVKPIADYELWGLVVSVNNIYAWYNMYHDKNSVNIKDICVVWGDNIKNGAYQNVRYKSGEWTCYVSWMHQLESPFLLNKLSNNHLFSDKASVRNVIKDMNIGDQIHLRGTLSSYAEGESNAYRTSSLTRDDTGNHACEVVYVNNAEIIKKRWPDWKYIFDSSKNLIFLTFLLQVFLFFYQNFRPIARAGNKN